MAKAQGLTLKDLLDAQRKLAAAGDKQAEAQVARLEAINKAESVAQVTAAPGNSVTAEQVKQLTQQTEELKKVNDEGLEEMKKDIHKGLIEKSGDGLNSNVIKLSKDIRTAIGGRAAATKPGAAVPVPPQVDKESARVSTAGKQSADMYQPGLTGGDAKNMFSLKGAFDVNRASGPLGDMLRKKVAKDDFIKNQMEINPQNKNLKQYQTDGKYDPKKEKAALGERFEKINIVRGEQKQNQDKIANLQAAGYTEQEIQRAGLRKGERELDAKMADADPRYAKQLKDVKAAEKASGKADPIKETAPQKDNVVSILAKSKKGLVGAPKEELDAEQQATAARMDAALATGKVQPIPGPADEMDAEQKAAAARMDAALATGQVQPIPGPASVAGVLTPEQQATAARMDAALRTGNVQPIPAGPVNQVSPTQREDIDRMNAAVREQFAPANVVSNAQPVIPGKGEPALIAPTAGMSTEETAESARLMQEQTELLKKIEENTRLGGSSAAGARKERAATDAAQPEKAEEGGSILSDVADFAMDKFGKKGGLAKAATAAKGFGGKALQFMGGKGGAIAGSVLAVGAGAYTAYEGWQTASQNEEGQKKAIDQAVAAGQITKEQGEAKKVEAEQLASVGKGEAVGEGGGMAAGAIGGAALGASIGSIIPGAGTVVGGLVGGAIGGFAGSTVGKAVGGYAVKGYQGIKSMFGFGGDQAAKPVAGAPIAGGEVTVESLQAQRDKLVKEGPATDSAQSKLAHKERLQQLDRAIAAKKAETTQTADGGGAAVTPENKVPVGAVGVTNNTSVQKIAGEDVVPGQSLSPKQAAVVEHSMAAGNKYSPQVMNSYNMAKQPAAAVAPIPTSADMIASKSADNAGAAAQQISSPTVISAPSSSTNISNTTSYSAKSPTRNSESSVRKFIDSRYAY